MTEKYIHLSDPANVETLYSKAKAEVFPHLRESCRELSNVFFEQMDNSKEYVIDEETNKALYYFVKHFKEIIPEASLAEELKVSLAELAEQVESNKKFNYEHYKHDDQQHQLF